ncbi:MAG TPA: glycosyltransferase family 2 protein [Usitatibacter sp.]|nr:glycosyltransferase family 2 protein [Usitatibacter sp.]
MPTVSVIVNVRDGAAFLAEALRSVLEQTYTDWELIVWDNASTDATPAIARALGERVRYFRSPEPVTLGRARDAAMREARGEWLAFLDHDDVWMPDKLARQVALAADPAVAIIYGRSLAFSARGAERDFDRAHEFDALPEGDIFAQLVAESSFIAMSSAMLRRSAVLGALPVPEPIHLIVDYFLYLELARGHRTRAVQGVVCRYRVHSASLTWTANDRMHVEALWLLDRWRRDIDPRVAARRRRIHSTGLAVREMRSTGTRSRGLARLLREGSPGFLCTRPLAWAWRAVRRRVRRPAWRTATS